MDYTYVLADMETYYQCSISKITENAFVYTVKIPKSNCFGSHFGTCTCGVPKRDGIPCEHMVMMAKAGVIEEDWFTRLSIMPYWLTTAHWRLQFPQTVVCRGDININIIKGKYQADNDIRYCPSWSGPNKSGRPSKSAGKRKPGLMDHIEKAGMKKPRKKRMYCSICQKFNHMTKNCYKNNVVNPVMMMAAAANDGNGDVVEGQEGRV